MAYSGLKNPKPAWIKANPQSSLKSLAQVVIAPRTGPEVLTGSTRLKAGTASKMILNMLTTLSMVRLGKVYRHWMVDLQPKSRKLRERGIRLVQELGRLPRAEAEDYFKKAKGSVKTALVMAGKGVDCKAAARLLRRHKGFLRPALDSD